MLKLSDESDLIRAENTLSLWASILADEGRDREAADALRVGSVILKFRTDFSEREKS